MGRIRTTLTVFVAVLAMSMLSLAAEHPIDLERSRIRIHVGKAGLFSAAGHEHWVAAPFASGAVEEGELGHIYFTVQSSRLAVEHDKDLKPEQQAEVQRTMQEKVLESAQYPEMTFRSTSMEKRGPDTLVVKGDLTLHGQTHPVSATVRRREGAYVGSCRFKQTTFGIHPGCEGEGRVGG